MKKFVVKLGELVCVVLLATLIAFVSLQDKISSQPFERVEQAVISVCDTEGLTQRDALEIKKKFSLEADAYADFVYYSSDSVMDVREVLVISVGNAQGVKAITQKIKEYVLEKAEIFEGYAPEESSMLSAHVLIGKKGYVLFYVGDNDEKVVSAFSQSL